MCKNLSFLLEIKIKVEICTLNPLKYCSTECVRGWSPYYLSGLPCWTREISGHQDKGPAEHRARRDPTRWLQGLGPKVNWKSHPDSQAASLAKVPIQRAKQNEIKSGQMDGAQGTKPKQQSAGQIAGWELKKVLEQSEFSAWEGRKY